MQPFESAGNSSTASGFGEQKGAPVAVPVECGDPAKGCGVGIRVADAYASSAGADELLLGQHRVEIEAHHVKLRQTPAEPLQSSQRRSGCASLTRPVMRSRAKNTSSWRNSVNACRPGSTGGSGGSQWLAASTCTRTLAE